jgi:hypothetical protein
MFSCYFLMTLPGRYLRLRCMPSRMTPRPVSVEMSRGGKCVLANSAPSLALKEWRNQARYPSQPVMWASTHAQVTCTQRDAGFITEEQNRDTKELLCTGLISLRASAQMRALRMRSSRSSCNCTADANKVRHPSVIMRSCWCQVYAPRRRMNQVDTSPCMNMQVLRGKARHRTVDAPHIQAHRNDQCNHSVSLVPSTRASVKNESDSQLKHKNASPQGQGAAGAHHRCTHSSTEDK